MPRTRLVERLIASAGTRVVLIEAPAGFGKSTVLGEWDEADGRPFARLTLDDRHDDPVLLTASVANAVGDLRPIDDEVYSALRGSRPGTLKVAVPRLLESLHETQGSLVLALDDVHELSDPESLGIVSALADGLPSGSQLALASRSRPSIRVGRLRANRALTELTARDLAMTEGEAERLLAACGLHLQTDSVSLLVERTEGWPAALYLAALSLQSADDADDAAREFAGDDRMVADYLRDEYVTSLTADQLDFLTRTSILDELNGGLCDAVLESEGSAGLLRDLAGANALVRSLDAKDQVFCYHALLREMLESELNRLHPRDAAQLHARASGWFAQRGDFDHAVPHAIATGDVDAAATLIWSLTADYTSMGREATLERWVDLFTGPEIDGSPHLCLVRATFSLAAGDGAGVEHWTSRTLTALEQNPRPDGEALRVARGAIRASGSAREGVIQMGADALAAFELLPDDETPWRALCRLIEGTASHLGGDPQPGTVALEDGVRLGAAAVPSVHALCLAQLALIALDDDPDQARRLSSKALARLEINALADQPTMALVFAIGALVEVRHGETAAASEHVKQATRLLSVLNEFSPWYEAETRIVIARALARLDDVAGARSQLADAGRLLRQTPDASVLTDWVQQAWKEADLATVGERWPLSPAELRLLHHLPTHLTLGEIADRSFVSPNTIKTQARSIYRKLGVSSRAEAVACARAAGLLERERLDGSSPRRSPSSEDAPGPDLA